jgi:hypothetical protein
MMVSVKQSVEWELAGETEVIGESLPQRHIATTNPTQLTSARNRPAVGSRRLTAWTMARRVFYLAKTVALYVKITYRVRKRYFLPTHTDHLT